MFAYIIGLYHRAINNQKLSTHERAVLKAIQGAIIGFFVSAVPQVFLVLMAHGQLNWTQSTINTLLTALALAILKLWASQTDAHMGDILDAYSKQLEAQAVNALTAPASLSTAPVLHIALPQPVSVAVTQQPVEEAAPKAPAPVALPELQKESRAEPVPTLIAEQPTGPMQPVAQDQQKSQFVPSPVVPLAERHNAPTEPNLDSVSPSAPPPAAS